MLLTLIALAAGIGLGIFCAAHRRAGALHNILSPLGRIATAALMLCIGLWMGGNPVFWQSLGSAGAAGAVLALAASAGSAALCWLVARRFFGGGRP